MPEFSLVACEQLEKRLEREMVGKFYKNVYSNLTAYFGSKDKLILSEG